MWCPLLATLWLGLGPASITVPVESLAFDVEAWKKAPQVEVRVMDGDRAVVYSGVPLALVLGGEVRGKGKERMAGMRALSDAVILVRAGDGYQVAVSAAAVAMDPGGERYLLALRRDGKELGEGQGPVRLIIPGDPQRVRWVRMVESLQLIRLRPGR